MTPTAGHRLAKMFDANEIKAIRAALIDHMKGRKAGTPAMEALTGVPARTIHRFVTGKDINQAAIAQLARFLDRQPRKPTVQHAFGRAAFNFYNYAPDVIGGVYTVSAADAPLSELTIKFTADRTYYLATERTTGRLLRVYEGILVFTGKAILALLKDRLMRSARVHMLHFNDEAKSFHGLAYDDGPLERGRVPYQLLQTTLERIRHAE